MINADSYPLLDGNCTVKEATLSGSVLVENMALGNSVTKSINSPFIMRSLIFGGTGGKYYVRLVIIVGL